MKKDQAHARNYPGRSIPKADAVCDVMHDQGALNSGRKNSLGVSANGSHKGLPSGKSGASTGGAFEKPTTGRDGGAELTASRKHHSLGTSADGSHKGLPAGKK